MKDKEKQIWQDVANVMCECEDKENFTERYNTKCRGCNLLCVIRHIVFFLNNSDYRKLNEDSVVLSREEYAELAQKIYDDIFAILKIKLWLYGDDAMTKNLNGLTKQKILDFTKKWGIKDNHLNEKDYSHIDHLQAHDKQIKEKSSKETAKKIFNSMFDGEIGSKYACKVMSVEKYNELAKQFGVEIKGV